MKERVIILVNRDEQYSYIQVYYNPSKEKNEETILYVRQLCMPRSDSELMYMYEVRSVFLRQNDKNKIHIFIKVAECVMNFTVVNEIQPSIPLMDH